MRGLLRSDGKTSRLALFALLSAVTTLAALLLSAPAQAGSYSWRAGPPSMGKGGPDPLMLPPLNPVQWELTIVTDGGFESNVAVCPGILFGQRLREGNYYLSLGGGILVDTLSVGLGAYSAFGYVSGNGEGMHFNAEYKQAVGVGTHLMFPGALRIGFLYEY